MELTAFWTICTSNGIMVEKDQLDSFVRYRNELLYWNEKVNLISRKETEEIFDRHILHSLSILRYVELPQRSKCIDIGTGGGFPGIPLKIARPDLHFTLVDSIAKKIKITGMMASHTGLKNIEAISCRAEDLHNNKKYSSYFDFVFSRAVAKTESIIEWSKFLIKRKSKIVLLKGGDLKDELDSAISLFPDMQFNVIEIDMLGTDWFKVDEKKIVICEFKSDND